MKAEHKKALRICSQIIFGAYIILLTYFLFFAESMGRTFESRTYHYNLVLFKEIRRFIVHSESLGTMAVVLNLFGNVAAFIPFGMILPIMHRRFRSFFYMLFLTFEFSLAVEVIQLVCKVGNGTRHMIINFPGKSIPKKELQGLCLHCCLQYSESP